MTVQMKDPNIDVNDESIDPVIRAAMIQQPSDQEEAKSADKTEVLTPEVPTENKEREDPEPTQEEAKPEDLEGKKADAEDTEEETTDKPTRKERREERKRFLDNVRREQEQKANNREQVYQADPNYKPLEFENKDYDFKELEEDRSKYGQNQFYKGANTAAEVERRAADQDKFWQATEYESRLLEREPDFVFMDDTKPETFDEDKAAFVNESYLAFVGYNQEDSTVQRTDISFEKYARTIVNQVKKWAEDYTDNTEKELAAQRSNAGIRPGGSSRKSLGQLKPGDISAMSTEEYERNREEINRQILAAL